MPLLVDSDVILDILTRDPVWHGWSADALSRHADHDRLMINAVIYSEISMGFERIEELETALPVDYFQRAPIPYEAAFLAGKCFLDYRRRRGQRHAPLPDFFIGAHAAVKGWTLLTRDATRYRTYFPGLAITAPDKP